MPPHLAKILAGDARESFVLDRIGDLFTPQQKISPLGRQCHPEYAPVRLAGDAGDKSTAGHSGNHLIHGLLGDEEPARKIGCGQAFMPGEKTKYCVLKPGYAQRPQRLFEARPQPLARLMEKVKRAGSLTFQTSPSLTSSGASI